MASPSPPGEEDAVCCMCGDHGLPRELFHCRSCRVRLQHSYCSDLYPRAASYRRCNWCLREPPPPAQVGAGAAGHAAVIAANGSNKTAAETKRKTAASNEDRHQRRHEGCSSGRPPAELGYPVKKKRKADERAPPDAEVKTGSCNNAAGESKELMRAGKARVKVRRYKLLAEVISC